MKKLKRIDEHKYFGGGSGYEVLNTDLFDVDVWTYREGVSTKLIVSDVCEITFEGACKSLNSDEKCIEQLTPSEILELIGRKQRLAYNEGSNKKVMELRKLMEIR